MPEKAEPWERIRAAAVRADALWPALLMAASGLWHINRPQLWQDELVTVDVAGRSTRQIIDLISRIDAVHGTYYLGLHRWTLIFGMSPLSVRLPSALAMAGAAGCVTLIGQRLFGRFAGILGGLFFVVVPTTVRFAQEARSYAGVVFLAALSTLLLLRAAERPSVRRWCGYAISLGALAMGNIVALSIVAGHGATLLLVYRESGRPVRRELLRFAAAVAAAAAAASWVVLLGLRQVDTQISWIDHESFWSVWPRVYASTALAWGVVALAVLALVRCGRPAWAAAALAVLPLLAVRLASLGDIGYFFPKYLLFVLPAWSVLAGAGLAALRWRTSPAWQVLPAVGLAVALFLAVPGQRAMRAEMSHSWYTYPDARVSQPLRYSEVAEYIASRYQPGDGIVYARGHWWLMHDVGVRYYLPERVRPRDVMVARSAAQAGALNAVECATATRCEPYEQRLWLVVPTTTDLPLAELREPQLRALAAYQQVSIEHRSEFTIVLLRRVS